MREGMVLEEIAFGESTLMMKILKFNTLKRELSQWQIEALIRMDRNFSLH